MSTEREDFPRVPGTSEEEPLLGGRGDASLPEGKPLYYNLVLGQLAWSLVSLCHETDIHRHGYRRASGSVDSE